MEISSAIMIIIIEVLCFDIDDLPVKVRTGLFKSILDYIN